MGIFRKFAADFVIGFVFPTLIEALEDWAESTETPIDDAMVMFLKQHKDEILAKVLLLI